MQRAIWLFGGVAGVLSATLEYLFYSGDNFNSQTLYLSKIILLAICVIFCIILVKKLKGGIISIGRTILSGLMVAVVKGIVCIAAFIVLYAPDGEFYERHAQEAMVEAERIINQETDLSTDEKVKKIAEAEHYLKKQFQPLGYSTSTLLESLVTAFVISVLMAAFVGTNMMYQQDDQLQE